ncbi:hypothetical protein ACFWPV_10150 [Streptomyces uncialis]|uniref:hypothetical protein n=1 Tax=Streptomyces uncialis TaxID=1048205 RepID=UPI003667BAD6
MTTLDTVTGILRQWADRNHAAPGTAESLVNALSAELRGGQAPDRFFAPPVVVHAFLTDNFAEDVVLRYQRAVGDQAVWEAARDQRTDAADRQLDDPRRADIVRAAADRIDPLKGGGGPYPASLIRLGKTTAATTPGTQE